MVVKDEGWLDTQTTKLLTTFGFQFFKVHGGGYQRSGIADFIAYRGGQLVLIENKHPNGTGFLKAIQYVKLCNFAQEGAISICSDDIEWTREHLIHGEPGGVYIPEKYKKQALKGLDHAL